ncbi:MAG: hypothetical protein AAF602_00925 [Myxococcota bacterium]
MPRPGFGEITGDCGVLDDEWNQTAPFLFRNRLDLSGVAWKGRSSADLTDGARQILLEGTRGGSSEVSEALAFDVMARCEPTRLLLTETAIQYRDAQGKKTDLYVTIDEQLVGISVTRALTFESPTERCGTPDEAAFSAFLDDKLLDLQRSRSNARADNPWNRSVLAVLACDEVHADVLEAAWRDADPLVQGDGIVVLTVTDGEDRFIYL